METSERMEAIMEKILFAMIGASDLKGNSSGYMAQGMCIPLAATEGARSVIEEIGEDMVADWMDANEILPPAAGGLWVAELEISNDQDGPLSYSIDACDWVTPTEEEIAGLINRQNVRGRLQSIEVCLPFTKVWTFEGALV
jgi:hypothetical protein